MVYWLLWIHVGLQSMTCCPRLRWWQWTGLSLLLVIVSIEVWVKIEQHIGALEIQRVIAALHAAGKTTTIDELRALSPPIDAQLQGNWNAWTEHVLDLNVPLLIPLPYHEWRDWIAGNVPNPPNGILDDLNKNRPLIDEARLLLRRDSLVISSSAWLAIDIPTGKREIDESDMATWPKNRPNLLVIRLLWDWLKRDALLSSSPADDLGDLDRLSHSLSHPALLIDAMIAISAEDNRNQTYLELAIAGRLPPSLRKDWLAEPSSELTMIADGFRGERILFTPTMIAHLSGYLPTLIDDYGMSTRHIMEWTNGLREIAFDIDIESRFEALLRNDITLQSPNKDDIDHKIQAIGGFAKMIPFQYSLGLDGEATHRLARLAMRILVATQKGSPLPSSQEEKEILDLIGDGNLLDPGGGCLKLRYDRIAPDRFSVSVDPKGPFPPFYDRGNRVVDHAALPRSKDSMIIGKLYIEIPVRKTEKTRSYNSPQHDDR